MNKPIHLPTFILIFVHDYKQQQPSNLFLVALQQLYWKEIPYVMNLPLKMAEYKTLRFLTKPWKILSRHRTALLFQIVTRSWILSKQSYIIKQQHNDMNEQPMLSLFLEKSNNISESKPTISLTIVEQFL